MAAPAPTSSPLVFSTVAQAQQVAAVFTARPREPVYFDTETTGLNARRHKMVAVQLKQGKRAPIIFDVRDNLGLVQALRPVFENLTLIGHNLKFDLGWLRMLDIKVEHNKVFDTQIAEQLLLGMGLSEARKAGVPVNLEGTARRYGIPVSKLERAWFYSPRPLNEREEWDEPFPDEEVSYMAQDVEVLGPIAEAQKSELLRLGLIETMRIEMRCLPALVEMEHAGIRIDVDGWRAFIEQKAAEAKALSDEVYVELGSAILAERIKKFDADTGVYTNYQQAIKQEEASLREAYNLAQGDLPRWGEFKTAQMKLWREANPTVSRPKLDQTAPNLDSSAQLIVGLTALGVPVPTKKNKQRKKVPTTEAKALEAIAKQYPIVHKLVEYRKATKFVSSFGDKTLRMVGSDGRIHPNYNQIGAGTGRMSCENPNWQQVPSRGDGKELRKNVKATPGSTFCIADFSNIEYRVMANLTLDPVVIAAFAAGKDLHTETARLVFKLPADWDKERMETEIWRNGWSYRDIGKTLNFLILFGGGAYKMAKEIGIETKEAEAIIAEYMSELAGVASWAKKTRASAHRDLCAKTMSGRRRPLHSPGPEPNPRQFKTKLDFDDKLAEWKTQRSKMEKQALNTPVQGTSADITKLALALFYESGAPGRLVACVHDEIVVESPIDKAEECGAMLAVAMKAACDTYLQASPVPAPKVAICDYWKK